LLLVVTLDAQAEECWVPSPFACFPFTSPTVRFHVPPDPESAYTYHEHFSLFPLPPAPFSIHSARLPLADPQQSQFPLNGALRTILAAELYYGTLIEF